MEGVNNIPLKVLVVDPINSTSEVLAHALMRIRNIVLIVKHAGSLSEAQTTLEENDFNTIYIDPISLGLEMASQFIFKTREVFPGIVFVLYIDYSRAESMGTEFYSGERKRFRHYFRLNKVTPIASFAEEVAASVHECQYDLRSRLTRDRINKLQEELASIKPDHFAETVTIPIQILQGIQESLESLKTMQQNKNPEVRPKTVFLSYRFAEAGYIEGIRTLLQREGFSIVTGNNANTFIRTGLINTSSC